MPQFFVVAIDQTGDVPRVRLNSFTGPFNETEAASQVRYRDWLDGEQGMTHARIEESELVAVCERYAAVC